MTALNVTNRTLFHGDNLDFLRGINSESIDLIATDPPFNKNKDFHATPDSLARGAKFEDRWRWDKDVHLEWIDQIKDDWRPVYEVIEAARYGAGMQPGGGKKARKCDLDHTDCKGHPGDNMAAFLCWLGVRVIEMRRVLKPTGSLYLHIDHTAHAWVKTMCDAIFGRQHFQNEIVWYYSGGGASRSRWARKHDTLLFYTKSAKWTFNVEEVRAPHKWVDGQRRADGSERNPDGKLPDDVIELHGIMPWAKEKTDYPTQKPLALYERIIKASSNEGDVVLDPFCGCATTPVAAERLGRQWLGADIWQGAAEQVYDRMRRETDASMNWNDIVTVTRTPPERTDEGDEAVPTLTLKVQRPIEPWQRLPHARIREHLAEAQAQGEGIVCAGCGRVLEREFMELDHILPRNDGGDNWITNRILICRPCNGKKSADLTMTGLRNRNKRDKWMRDESLARIAETKAKDKAEQVRNEG